MSLAHDPTRSVATADLRETQFVADQADVTGESVAFAPAQLPQKPATGRYSLADEIARRSIPAEKY